MRYLESVKMGCLHNGESIVDIPIRPYNTKEEIFLNSGLGDIHPFNRAEDEWSIVDANGSNELISWNKFNINGKIVYICDRVLINRIKKEDLLKLIFDKNIILNNKKYKLRILYKNEWDKLVDECSCIGIPLNIIRGVEDKPSKNKLTSNHNLFWNWLGIGSYVLSGDDILTKGNYYPSYENLPTFESDMIGFRPVLEEYVEQPIIECETGRLGEINEPFNYPYSVTTYLDDDTLRIKEKFNGDVVKEYTTSVPYVLNEMNIGKYWNNSMYGVQQLEIEVTNKNGETVSKRATFSTELPTFVDKGGLQYFMTKLWNNKIKTFVQEFSKKQGGLILDSSMSFTGSGTKSANAYVDNGEAIRHSVASTSTLIAKFNTTDLRLGRHGVVVRASLSDGTHSNNVFTVTVYRKASNGTRTSLGSRHFKANEFVGGSDSFKCAYFVFDYSTVKNAGDSVDVEITSVSGATTNTFMLDYMLISPILPAVYN